MKTVVLILLLWTPNLLLAQTTPSTAIRQTRHTVDTADAVRLIDSLIKLNQMLIRKGQLKDALQVILQADSICRTTPGPVSESYAEVLYQAGTTYRRLRALDEAERYYRRSGEIAFQLGGEQHPQYIRSVYGLALHFRALKAVPRADSLFRTCLDLTRRFQGKEHPDYSRYLIGHAMLYYEQGEYQTAEPIYTEALLYREKTLGKYHQDVASTKIGLGYLQFLNGQYEASEKLYTEAGIALDSLGLHGDPSYQVLLQNQGTLYNTLGNTAMAEKTYLKLKDLLESSGNQGSRQYALVLENLAGTYTASARYAAAEKLFREAIALRTKEVGNQHPDYALSIRKLAGYMKARGRFEEADALYQESLPILEAALGRQHPECLALLESMAINYGEMGNPHKAEPLFLFVLKAMADQVGKDHPNYSITLNNLAVFYHRMGSFEKAEPLYLQALEIKKKVFGEQHDDYAFDLNNLGFLYNEMGRYADAEKAFQKSKETWAAALGTEHAEYARALMGLANCHTDQSRYEDAEPLYREAEQIRRNQLGEKHPDYIFTLDALGEICYLTGRYQEAEQYLLKGKNVREAIYGIAHPDYSWSLLRMIRLKRKTNAQSETAELLQLLFQNQQAQLSSAFSFLSEQEQACFIQRNIQPFSAQIHSAATPTASPAMRDIQYELALLLKGAQLRAGKNTLSYVLQQQDSSALGIYRQLLAERRLLAKLYQLPVSERENLEAMEKREEELEKALIRLSATYRRESMEARVSRKDVHAALKKGEAAIEFVQYAYYNPDHTDSLMYAAVVLRPEEKHAFFIPLFEEDTLIRAIEATRQGNAGTAIAQLYGARGVVPIKNRPVLATPLFNLVWQPLDSLLEGIHTVYFAPAGLLHQINLAALPVSGNVVLGDRYKLHRLSSTRKLAMRSLESDESGSKSALLLGGIQYADAVPAQLEPNAQEHASDLLQGDFGFSALERGRGEQAAPWTYLPGTAEEVRRINAVLLQAGYSSRLLTGEEANEEAVKTIGLQSAAPKVLHLATHGFFFPNPQAEAPSPGRGLGEAEPAFKISDHPMIRSGLILAGANRVWQGEGSLPGREDGILTAYEISQMNLSNTELVVLSACETGLGDIQGNEGVYGLQRAFKIAGARYLIMSLWQVPDQETSVFMETFYRHWIVDNMTIPDAFRATQQAMRERFVNPYQWAGFVLVE
ncbi:MAG: CHAT domain-containing protein [Lewinellaceae bacterium]|nr:CHAT domain-containing protein [Lewinellaceae bacterium]